ncbi:MAG: HEAT repeat domain-containing protein [Candidatus Delongbacteria bacterium]|nr:HEAT repeat domain-containing protein [Candidatus Delongbacteria bacterium]
MNKLSRFFGGFALLLLFPSLFSAKTLILKPNRHYVSAFAVVVDSKTYQKIKPSIDRYRQSIEDDSLSVYLIADQWKNPEQVRQAIQSLHRQDSLLEGVALVGDVPIAMIRNAQHTTSAFKMDQERYSIRETSVPSDRFYEDFDLKFDFIRQDSSDRQLFYYSLRSESPQEISKELYSGRIYPPVRDSSRYSRIAAYLDKLVALKKDLPVLQQALFIAGHGYHSESLNAWEGELVQLNQQFPQFYSSPGRLNYYYHTMTQKLKSIVMRELENPIYDLAVFHAHGDVEQQYLLGDPPVYTLDQYVDRFKAGLRSQVHNGLRRKKNLDTLKMNLCQTYQIPESWLEGVLSDSLRVVDSLEMLTRDLYSADIRSITPHPPVVIFDECYNGRFVDTAYISGEYVFGRGNTVAGIANSVNVLQDIVANEHLGLLSFGVRIGQWHRFRNYLESHLIGDPTFRFKSLDRPEIRDLLSRNFVCPEKWEQWLNDENPVVRTLAVDLWSNRLVAGMPAKLMTMFQQEDASVVRLEIVKAMAKHPGPEFYAVLKLGIGDPDEMVRRKSILWMGETGLPEFIPFLLQVQFSDLSERIVFNSKSALEKFPPEQVQTAGDSLLKSIPAGRYHDEAADRLPVLIKSLMNFDDELATMANDSLSLKKRIGSVRIFRNVRSHHLVPRLADMALKEGFPPELRAAVLEALGWFSFSLQKPRIIQTCDQLITQSGLPTIVKNEAVRTRERLLEGPNQVFTP